MLRYAYLPDGRMINEVLVETGFAQAKAYPPDIKYQERLAQAQQRAFDKRIGIWLACSITPVPTPTPVPTLGCNIKGNINSGKKIYHMPSDPGYDLVQIDSAKGERWFCSEADAIASGWRKRK